MEIAEMAADNTILQPIYSAAASTASTAAPD
jgi:hypothetical protein